MFDDCEYASDASSVLRRVSKNEAGWLARFARERVQQERETLELGLEQELQVMSASFIPIVTHAEDCAVGVSTTLVRSFRVLLMRDARATRRRAHLVVELTVWDVLSLSFDEASAGQFKEGQRFQVRPVSRLVGLDFLVLTPEVSVCSLIFLGDEFASDAQECVYGSRRGRRSCVSQHEQDFTMDQTLVMIDFPHWDQQLC